MTAGLSDVPKFSPQNECPDKTQRAAQIYERAKMFRRLVVFSTFAISISTLAFPAVFTPLVDTVIRSPVACGIWLFVSFFTFALERSTRIQRDNCLEPWETD